MRVSSALISALLMAACGDAGDTNAAPARQAAAALHPALKKATGAQAGTPAPGDSFAGADGKPLTLAAYRGRPVLLNLWATWCAPCIAEMPALDRLQGRAGDKLTVLPVAEDMGGKRAVDRFARPGRFKNLTFPIDKETNLGVALKANGLPVTVLYDARGREVWRVAGPVEWDLIPVNALLP